MSTEDLQKRTTVNIQEKANLIWAIADKLVGTYKPHEYGNVILPMCVIKRFSDTVAPQREQLEQEGVTATVYDMAMGTSQMLDCLSEKLLEIDPEAQITEFGQELNEQTFAIAKANVLIKGGDAHLQELEKQETALMAKIMGR